VRDVYQQRCLLDLGRGRSWQLRIAAELDELADL
jgi:hypothetical protein